MTFYHESLDICLSALIESGILVNDDVLVIRDASGRLTVAISDRALAKRIEPKLKDHLGTYAATPPVVSGQLATSLQADPATRPVERILNGQSVLFRYLDRRIVGTDWLAGPLEREPAARKRIVFASLKGGVGRTTALTVAAAHFAKQGLRVLAIDLDLEASGIGSMLLHCKPSDAIDQRPRFGVIDYLVESNIQDIPDENLIDFIGKSPFADGFIDVIPATGRETDTRPSEFIPKLSRAITDAIKDGNLIPFFEKIQNLVSRFESFGNYDIVLIDARAGIAEITAAPIMTLGANILLFATDQQQTFTGYSYLLSHMSSQTDFSKVDYNSDWRSTLTFVQSKSPSSERQRQSFRDKLYDLCATWLYEEDAEGLSFNYSPLEVGLQVPHDATFIKYEQGYDAFDPTINGEQLDAEIFSGPFGPFLEKLDSILGIAEQQA